MRSAIVMASLVAVLALRSEAASATQSPPSDFALRFAYGLCTTDVLDTFKGVFTRDMGSQEPAVSIPIVLQAATADAIYTQVVASKFSDYPELFRVQGQIGFAPAMHYKLETRMSGVNHSVTWVDGTKPSTPEADQLRSLFTKLISLITNYPEVKKLPHAKVACG